MTFHLITHHQFLHLILFIIFSYRLRCDRWCLPFLKLFHLKLHHLLYFVHAYGLSLCVLINFLHLLHDLLDISICITRLEGLDKAIHLLAIGLIFQEQVAISLLNCHHCAIVQSDIKIISNSRRDSHFELFYLENLFSIMLQWSVI